MTSEKKGKILKIGIFISIIIGSFLICKITLACTIYKPLTCSDGTTHSYGVSMNDANDNWMCGIEKVGGSFFYCDGGNLYASNIPQTEYQDANIWLKEHVCPDTSLYNEATCILADSMADFWGTYSCSEQYAAEQLRGRWDAFEKQCVKCDGGLIQLKKLADTSQRCFNFTDPGTWAELPCATIIQTCESACGASPECDEVDFGMRIVVPEGICNNCILERPCSWQNDICGGPLCPATQRLQTCGPAGCFDGVCVEGTTQCIADPVCDCESTCTCKCPAGIPCPGGECKGGLVPCGRTCDDPCTKNCECAPCTLCHLFVLFKRIVDFLTLNIIFPLAVLMIVVGGVMFLTAGGDPGRIGGAKKILTATIIGLVIILVAWLIVDTIIMFLTPADSPFRNWSDIPCPVCGDGVCESGETPENCPADCGAPPPSVCSNLSCQGSETNCQCGTAQTTAANPWCCAASNSVYASQANCQADPACAAGPPICPDGTCDVAGGECGSCPADCTVAACCGNSICDTAVGENSTNCPGDCPVSACPPCIVCP